MSYKYTDILVDDNNFELSESKKIHPCLLKNNHNDLMKAIGFLGSDEKYLYIHGFLGTGKRQFVNYICDYLSKDVLRLEYYCKEATVCDDILLYFTDLLEKSSATKTLKLNAKIMTLTVKFQKMIESVKKPILIILHSLDNMNDDNLSIVSEFFSKILREPNIKLIATTCALKPGLMGDVDEDRNIFLKPLTKEIFAEFFKQNGIKASDRQIEDFYEITRGYYLYAALSIKVMQSLNISLVEFMQKFKNANLTFDTYLCDYYISLIPVAIRNFFWFLRAIRHGISLNALAILEIYDEFSIQYLITNLIAFQSDDILYLHDYFASKVEITLPVNTEIKLHKYIVGIYEQQLKEALANRAILISRQALRAEIEYHTDKIYELENGGSAKPKKIVEADNQINKNQEDVPSGTENKEKSVSNLIDEAKHLADEDKLTEAIEKLQQVISDNEINSNLLNDARLNLAKLYVRIGDCTSAMHYYELVESYYKNNNELINLNYLHYEMTELFYKTYKNDRAIDTIKKVIYSVDTPQSLMVAACTLLGNIYSDMNNPDDAFSYYQKALDSLDENVDSAVLAELYFKFALANDDKGDMNLAFEYYSRCVSITENNKYLSSAYSNLASCYYENKNYDDALNCFVKAYNIEKKLNNYEGVYYTSSHIAKIMCEQENKDALKFLTEAKQSAEFVNEPFYIVEASTALGDYYYNIPNKAKDALSEYCKARQTVYNFAENIDISNITKRIEDMKLRMPEDDFAEIMRKYEG